MKLSGWPICLAIRFCRNDYFFLRKHYFGLAICITNNKITLSRPQKMKFRLISPKEALCHNG